LIGNDFWNNLTNIEAQPQDPYSCISDAGAWDIQGNDILRGPVNSEYWSWDVRTPPGSSRAAYSVDATDNWWGTTDEERAQARLRADVPTAGGGKYISQSPISQQPHTAWEPSGEVPDPESPGPTYYDPGVISDIGEPRHTQCLEARGLTALKGTLHPALSDSDRVILTLRKETQSGCRWWSARLERFVERACERPVKFKPRVRPRKSYGYRWAYRFPRLLRPGRYELTSDTRSEWINIDRNRVNFRLL
jgi:hypothetical protein